MLTDARELVFGWYRLGGVGSLLMGLLAMALAAFVFRAGHTGGAILFALWAVFAFAVAIYRVVRAGESLMFRRSLARAIKLARSRAGSADTVIDNRPRPEDWAN